LNSRPLKHPLLMGGANILQFCWSVSEMTLTIAFSAGVLAFIQHYVNMAPNWLGKQVIAASYIVYIIHPLIVIP
jgi:hypothetical protein